MSALELGILVNSALYLAGCMAAGLATGNRTAWTFALADAGVLYLGYLALYMGAPRGLLAMAWLPWTVVLGVAAGGALLVL